MRACRGQQEGENSMQDEDCDAYRIDRVENYLQLVKRYIRELILEQNSRICSRKRKRTLSADKKHYCYLLMKLPSSAKAQAKLR